VAIPAAVPAAVGVREGSTVAVGGDAASPGVSVAAIAVAVGSSPVGDGPHPEAAVSTTTVTIIQRRSLPNTISPLPRLTLIPALVQPGPGTPTYGKRFKMSGINT
jgi:hypothetical protein